ncbi:MAG: adenosylcobinamide-phosphate synthase CbiB [Thermincola sp.]|jgi:adenosylcobinamide-phosphate synthase|nr:adenosylcobinamide-phosphate synthase CbiB [Thermincola sp.]MDT3701633.1 adenosylcobinamide-phosphate synthase CbiB [Thermincola sp.]
MLQVLAAYLLDLIIGDPRKIPHPVVIIGKGIDLTEKYLRRWAAPFIGLKASGVVLTCIIVGSTYTIMWAITTGAARISEWLGLAVSIWFISTTLAVKGLGDAAMEIYTLLSNGDLTEARRKVGWIVGRDTGHLNEGEITRATVETVAENLADGVIAPLLFAFIGGAPLAMAYKAVNTLDSMVGYKNDKYRDLGWASARFDDLCNYIPARLTGLMLLVTFVFLGKPVRQVLRVVLRDAPSHPSPNSGIPEAAVAGALGIRLGGINYYGGVESFRAHMGDPREELEKGHILSTVRIMRVASGLTVLLGAGLIYLIRMGAL